MDIKLMKWRNGTLITTSDGIWSREHDKKLFKVNLLHPEGNDEMIGIWALDSDELEKALPRYAEKNGLSYDIISPEGGDNDDSDVLPQL